jgi:hypothetical protein
MEYLKSFLKDNIITQNELHCVYNLPLKTFSQLPIKRWKYNRPPDKQRVAEIHDYIRVSHRVDGIIYLASIDNELVCYESNHRREALREIETVANVLVDIIWDTNDETIKTEFIRLNKSVSIPELYVENVVNVDIDKLRTIIDDFCVAYKTHKVASGKPQRPNFNRDNFTDDLYRIIKEHNISIEKVMDKLADYNRVLTVKDKSKLSEKIIQKCSDSGLWIFAWSSRLNEKEFL